MSSISEISDESILCVRGALEKYLLRSGWSSGIAMPSGRNCTMEDLQISLNLPHSAANTSGGGWPKSTKRKWPLGGSRHIASWHFRQFLSSSQPRAFLAVTDSKIGDDHAVARRSQYRCDVDKAVNVVGPAVEKNDRGTIGGARFSVAIFSRPASICLSEPNEVFDPGFVAGRSAGLGFAGCAFAGLSMPRLMLPSFTKA
jgi:hypothetical protein